MNTRQVKDWTRWIRSITTLAVAGFLQLQLLAFYKQKQRITTEERSRAWWPGGHINHAYTAGSYGYHIHKSYAARAVLPVYVSNSMDGWIRAPSSSCLPTSICAVPSSVSMHDHGNVKDTLDYLMKWIVCLLSQNTWMQGAEYRSSVFSFHTSAWNH
jgi:hypothetical protein